MSVRTTAAPRAVLEGLAGGAAAGTFLFLAERSPTYAAFADVLNAAFRILGGLVAEETRVHLDTEIVALAAYAGTSALAGVAIGAFLGVMERAGLPSGPTRRAALFGGVLGAAYLALFGAVWLHRGLPLSVGTAVVACAAMIAAAVARLAGAVLRTLLDRRTVRSLAGIVPAVVALGCAGAMIVARKGPERPSGEATSSRDRSDTSVSVAILALDGLDWFIVDQALAEGRLPNLGRLVREGVRGNLRSLRPPRSPVVWTSVATGTLPFQHGIRDFVTQREGLRTPVTSNLRRRHALWDMAEIAGFTTAFVNWYVTWPAERAAGVIISDRVDFDGLERRVWPEELAAAVDSARARVDAREDRGIGAFLEGDGKLSTWRARQWGQTRRAIEVLDDVIRHDLVTMETARVALRGGQPDLTALYFRGNDNTQHLFWKHHASRRIPGWVSSRLWPTLSREEADAMHAVVDRYYDFMDRLVGEALSLLSPETAVLVLSDHGFLAGNERGRWHHGNRLLVEAGLAEPAAGTGGDAVPERSVAYDESSPSTARVRVIRPGVGAHPAEALARARSVLEEARTDRGGAVFDSLRQETDEKGPYLAARFAEELSGSAVRIAGGSVPLREIVEPEGHSGNHRMNGVLIASGAPFRRGARIAGARAVDVAPTVLHVLGVPLAPDLEGVPLLGALDPEWRSAHPVRRSAPLGALSADGSALPTDADERIRETLRTLGYLD